MLHFNLYGGGVFTGFPFTAHEMAIEELPAFFTSHKKYTKLYFTAWMSFDGVISMSNAEKVVNAIITSGNNSCLHVDTKLTTQS